MMKKLLNEGYMLCGNGYYASNQGVPQNPQDAEAIIRNTYAKQKGVLDGDQDQQSPTPPKTSEAVTVKMISGEGGKIRPTLKQSSHHTTTKNTQEPLIIDICKAISAENNLHVHDTPEQESTVKLEKNVDNKITEPAPGEIGRAHV